MSTALPIQLWRKNKKVKSNSWARKCTWIQAKTFNKIKTTMSSSKTTNENQNQTQWMKPAVQNQIQEVEAGAATNWLINNMKISHKIIITKGATIKRTVVLGLTTIIMAQSTRKDGLEDIMVPIVTIADSLLNRSCKWFNLILTNATMILLKNGKFWMVISWSSLLKK